MVILATSSVVRAGFLGIFSVVALLRAQRYMAGKAPVSLDNFRGSIVESIGICGWLWPYIGSVSPSS